MSEYLHRDAGLDERLASHGRIIARSDGFLRVLKMARTSGMVNYVLQMLI